MRGISVCRLERRKMGEEERGGGQEREREGGKTSGGERGRWREKGRGS